MIAVKDLYFAYGRKQPNVLKNIQFDIPKGEVFGFLGPSGAGKSTLQKILLGLLKKYKGSVKVLGEDVNQMSGAYYDEIGVGFELPNLYEQLTVLENLETFRGLYKHPADINSLLKDVGLYEHRFKKVRELSKGMKMRLNFCRALVGNPSILFLDEPTSGLDPNNTKVIQDKILAYKNEGNTVVVTTHNMSFAEQVCDRVAFVVDGTIKEVDSPGHLRSKYGRAKVKVITESNSYEFPVEGIKENEVFRNCLSEGIVSIDTERPTLEEIFTMVTGRVLV